MYDYHLFLLFAIAANRNENKCEKVVNTSKKKNVTNYSHFLYFFRIINYKLSFYRDTYYNLFLPDCNFSNYFKFFPDLSKNGSFFFFTRYQRLNCHMYFIKCSASWKTILNNNNSNFSKQLLLSIVCHFKYMQFRRHRFSQMPITRW